MEMGKLERFHLRTLGGSTILNTEWEVREQEILHDVLRDGDAILQLGGNIGASCVTAARSKRLSSNVCVEPSNALIDILRHNCRSDGVQVVHGIIAEDCAGKRLTGGGGTAHNDWAARVTSSGEGQSLTCHPLASVAPKDGFSVLFADCEGCLPEFIDTYGSELREKHPQLRAVVFERDGNEDYHGVDAWLRESNFECTGGFHTTCTREPAQYDCGAASRAKRTAAVLFVLLLTGVLAWVGGWLLAACV